MSTMIERTIDIHHDTDGQMVVEMAVTVPVALVVALVVCNLLMFIELTARFDRIVPDVVMACAVSPSGDDAQTGDQSHQIAEALRSAMGDREDLDIEVRAENAWEAAQEDSGTPGFSFAPYLTRYACTFRYHPWPATITIAGIDAQVPLTMPHTRSFVVDRYRSGVLF